MTAHRGTEIIRLTDEPELDVCAGMMASSNPWNTLFFSNAECRAMLAEPNLVVHGCLAKESVDVLGFMATAALGIGSEPLIEYLCVQESARNAGIGSRLVSFAEDDLFGSADNIYLFVSDINPDAVRLYERLEYQKVGTLPDFNLCGQDEFLYRKSRRPRQRAEAYFVAS